MRYKPKYAKRKTTYYPAWSMHIAALLGCFALISIYMLSGVYSKFHSAASDGNQARIAHFSPSFVSQKIDISNAKPGHTHEVEFTVQNFSDEALSEVAMKYKIVLKTTGNIPLKFTICKSDGSTLKEFTCDGISGKQEYVYTDSSLVFNAGVKETRAYQLKAEWPESENDARFSGMTDAVYLEVVFEQLD